MNKKKLQFCVSYVCISVFYFLSFFLSVQFKRSFKRLDFLNGKNYGMCIDMGRYSRLQCQGIMSTISNFMSCLVLFLLSFGPNLPFSLQFGFKSSVSFLLITVD